MIKKTENLNTQREGIKRSPNHSHGLKNSILSIATTLSLAACAPNIQQLNQDINICKEQQDQIKKEATKLVDSYNKHLLKLQSLGGKDINLKNIIQDEANIIQGYEDAYNKAHEKQQKLEAKKPEAIVKSVDDANNKNCQLIITNPNGTKNINNLQKIGE